MKKWVVLALAAALLISSAALLNLYPAPQARGYRESGLNDAFFTPDPGGTRLLFSATEHFYNSDLEIAIKASVPGIPIYYTTDGSEPTDGSAEYDEPLRFTAGDELAVITLKAIAVDGDTVTRPLVHTYFIGKNIDRRFHTLVFSLSTDPRHLFDVDDGIFIEGRARDEFIGENPDVSIDPFHPANYNQRGRESERPVYVETFTPDGNRVVAQAAGIRIHGGWSRSFEQKSIRLIARDEYEPGMGKFRYDFFPDDTKADGYGSPLAKYDTLILRNGGNDRYEGMLRNEAGSELARKAGLRVVTPVRAAAVFINGEYYGFAWVNVRINEKYLQDVFSAPTDEFQIVGKGELWLDTEDPDEIEAIGIFNSYYEKDLTDDTIFAEFEALVDIDELLVYYAFQTYMGNVDWPVNNVKRWRYTGPQEDGLAPELDGRWRFVVYDLDWVLGLNNSFGSERPTFEQMMTEGETRYSRMMTALLKRPDIADRFSMALCDIAANVVTGQHVGEVIGRLYGGARWEIEQALLGGTVEGMSMERAGQNHADMIRFAEGRAGYMFNTLREYFKYGPGTFSIEVTGGQALIGTQAGAAARYFDHLTVPLRPVLPKYTAFDHWVVNGVKVYEPELTVSPADAVNGVVRVELMTQEALPPLMFTEAYSSPERSGCGLVNLTGQTVRTGGLYLTNDPQNPFLWALPNAAVKPGRGLEFAGKGSLDPGDLHKIRLGFNVKQGRMLYLCDASGMVLDTITV